MGYLSFSIPKDLVLKINEYLPFENFVETGTYHGGSCFWAANYIKNIYTIEIDETISKATAARPDCPANIVFLVGDSKAVLPGLVKEIKGDTLFWLDGHWCPGAGGQESECPLIEEIQAIKDLQEAVIFIDDARLFLGPLPAPHNTRHWPRIDEIFFKLKECFPNHVITIHDDVIMCFPQKIASVIDQDWLEKYNERFAVVDQSEPNKNAAYQQIKQKIKRVLK